MSVTVLPVRQPHVIWKPYAVLAALQVLDVATTGIILRFFAGSAEGNPVADFILNSAGLALGLLLLLAFKLGTVWLFYDCQTRVRLANAIYSLVIINNILFGVLWLWFR